MTEHGYDITNMGLVGSGDVPRAPSDFRLCIEYVPETDERFSSSYLLIKSNYVKDIYERIY